MFVWTDVLDALTPPRRGEGAALVGQHMGWRRLFCTAYKARAIGYEPRASLVHLMTTGRGVNIADEADAFLLACTAPRRGTGVGKLSGLSESEAEKVACAGVDRWVGLYGLVKAIEIFSLLGAWRPGPLFRDERVRIRAAERLRRWLARADDATYEEALAYVEREDGLPHGMRGWRGAGREAIAYLFPDHRPFFERAVAELGERTTMLLGAIGDLADYERIRDRIGDGDLERNALVLARVLGEDGFSILASQPTQFVSVARALTAYVSPEAARAIARFAANRQAHPIVRAYFERHPELAGALEPLVHATDRSLRSGARALAHTFE